MLMHLINPSFQIGPFHGSHGGKSRVKVRVSLDLHGILNIESATVSKKPLLSFHILLVFLRDLWT